MPPATYQVSYFPAKQNEIIDALVKRVEKLEQSVPTKRNPFEVDIVATKESLRKLKETILGIFQ